MLFLHLVMKRLLFVILLCTLTVFVHGQGLSSGKSTTMKFGADVWDFGTIKEADGAVKHVFEFTNAGTKPFVIENVSVSCGCTTPTYSRAPIRPGTKGSITIYFDPTGRPGAFNKEIYITSNNLSNQNIIRITGTVEGRPRSIEDDYPVLVSSGLRLSSLSVNFGYVPQRCVRSMTLPYINTSSKSISLSVGYDSMKPYFTATVPSTICAGCRGDITLTYDLRSVIAWGMLSQSVFLTVNGKQSAIPVSATAVGTDDFTGVNRENAPQIRVTGLFFHLGDIKQTAASVSKELTISNDGKQPLLIRDVALRDGCVSTLKSGITVEPGGSVTFTVTIYPSKFEKGRLYTSLFVVTNDPMRPLREFRFVANII